MRTTVPLLQPNVTKESNVGEIGCGGGRVTVEVRKCVVLYEQTRLVSFVVFCVQV